MAWRYAASASDGLSLFDSRLPIRRIVFARSRRVSFVAPTAPVSTSRSDRRLAEHPQAVVGVTRGVQQVAEPGPAVGQGGTHRRRGRARIPRADSRRSASRYVATASLVLSVDLSSPATAVRLRPTSAWISGAAFGSAASASRDASTRRCASAPPLCGRPCRSNPPPRTPPAPAPDASRSRSPCPASAASLP